MRAALYIRVSTDDQTEYSPSAQKRLLIDYAKKNGYIIEPDHIYIDDGYSGRKAEKRPAFMQMVHAAHSKPVPFDVILVHKFDRFARNREDSVVYKSMLKKDGVRVISITEHIEDDKFAVIMESMLDAMAEYYSINLSEEVRKGMAEKALRGGVQSMPPIGYTVQNNELVLIPEEAEVVRYIFDQFAAGKSAYSIGKSLNLAGKRTKNGNLFQTAAVRFIAQNPIYMGKMYWKPNGRRAKNGFNGDGCIISDGKHEPIVTPEEFQNVQNIIAQARSRSSHAQPAIKKKHWLSGILRCSACGSSMCFSGSASPGFQCRKYTSGSCLVSHRISVKIAEEIVFASLQSIVDGNCTKYNFVERDSSVRSLELAGIRQALEKIPSKLERAKTSYLEGIDSAEEYKVMKNSILAEKEELEKRLTEYQEPKVDIESFRAQVQNLISFLRSDSSIEEKSTAAQGLIQKIIYNKQSEILEFYYFV